MTLIRWVSFLLAAECMVALWFAPPGVGSMILAALFFMFFIIYCAAVGAVSRKATS